MGAMFLVLPALFLTAMSWAGYNFGSMAEGMMGKGSIASQNAASKGTDALISSVAKSKKR
jgi:hypothetical protein